MISRKIAEINKSNITYYITPLFPGRPVVVFLHGLSANHTVWIPIMERLSQEQYNTLALDLRGHGESDKTKIRSRYILPAFTNDLKSVLQQAGLNHIILVGYSFGGSIALDYASRYPHEVRGLILISTNFAKPLFYKKIGFLTYPAYLLLQALAWLFRWQKRKQYHKYDHTRAAGYWHSVWIGLNTMPLSINFWMLAETLRFDFRKKAGNITAKTIIARAESDPFLSEAETRAMARAIPNATVVTPSHKSHFIASQAEEETASIILNFLKTL